MIKNGRVQQKMAKYDKNLQKRGWLSRLRTASYDIKA